MTRADECGVCETTEEIVEIDSLPFNLCVEHARELREELDEALAESDDDDESEDG